MTNDSTSAPERGTRQRLDHVDAMRPVKQAAVISTHAVIFLAPVTAGLASANILIFTHFSREAFLFVSACMLAYSYREVARVELAHYWRRRFIAVGVPYLAWTLIYYFYVTLEPQSAFPYYHFAGALSFSAYGAHRLVHFYTTGYYHLYYLLVLLEFYVVFPLVLIGVRRLTRWHGRLMLAALAFQVLYCMFWPQIYSVAVHAHISTRGHQSFWETRLITSYALYLVAGVVVAIHLDDVHDWICSHWRLILPGTVAAGACAVALNYWHGSGFVHDILVPGYNPFVITVIPYTVGAILSVYLLGVYLVSPRRSPRTRAVVKSGSDNSYGIYLSQLIWIPVLGRLITNWNPPIAWPIVTLSAVAVVYLLGFGFSALAARTALARPLTGRSRVSWTSLRPRWRTSSFVLTPSFDDGPLDLTETD